MFSTFDLCLLLYVIRLAGWLKHCSVSLSLVLDSTLPVCHYVDCDDHDEPQCRAVMPLCSDISVALHDSKVLVTLQHVLYLGILAVWSTVTSHMIVHDAVDTHSGLKTRVG